MTNIVSRPVTMMLCSPCGITDNRYDDSQGGRLVGEMIVRVVDWLASVRLYLSTSVLYHRSQEGSQVGRYHIWQTHHTNTHHTLPHQHTGL